MTSPGLSEPQNGVGDRPSQRLYVLELREISVSSPQVFSIMQPRCKWQIKARIRDVNSHPG